MSSRRLPFLLALAFLLPVPARAQYGAPVAPPAEPVPGAVARKVPQPRLSPSQAVTVAAVDIDGINSVDQPFMQYLWKPRVEDDENELAEFETALRLHVNILSREATFGNVYRVAPGLWRVDRREFDWRKVQFDNLAKIDPYFHRQQIKVVVEEVEVDVQVEVPCYGYDIYGRQIHVGNRVETRRQKKRVQRQVSSNILFAPLVAGQLASLSLLTRSNAPILRADWFIAQTCRQLDSRNRDNTGAGYYDFLQLRNLDDYFRLVGLRNNDVDRLGNEMRAVSRFSGVSAQNRQIVLRNGGTGRVWFTLEFFDQAGRGVAINNLRDGEALPDAFEFYAHNRNGLPVTALSDNKGNLQATVPDKVASNRCTRNISNDLKVHVNIACWQCHSSVLQDVADDVRATYTGRLTSTSNDKRLDLELRRAYTSDFLRELRRDRAEYAEVIRSLTGLTPSAASDLYSKVVTDHLVRPVTLTIAARELGLTEAQLLKGLAESNYRVGRGDFRTDPFLEPEPVPIPRLDWEDGLTVAQDAAFGVLQLNDPTIREGGTDKEDGNHPRTPKKGR